MKQYLLKRLFQALGVIFAISLITFFVLNIVPGNPVQLMLGEFADQATIARVTHEMGLDQPLYIQYFKWLTNMLKGDFGISYFQNKPVLDIMIPAFVVTAKVALLAYVFAVVSGIVCGVVAAYFHGKWQDRFLMTVAVLGISAPVFWLAIILQIFLCLKLDLFPISGLDSFSAYILPSFTLGLRYAAGIARITRTSMLEVINQDYMRTAYAKGVSKWNALLKHAFRNALIPIITVTGTDLGNILTGSLLIESVFSIQGIGKMLLDAINNRDLPIIQGGVMYIAAICVVVYFLVDLAYAAADPKIRLGKESEG